MLQKENVIGERFKMNGKELIYFPLVTFITYLTIAFFILFNGHLHEDAYILYIFSESFASGNGIAYFPGGPPAEGATDFLWMIALGIGSFLGIDVAILASILNGLGLSFITFFAMLIARNGIGGIWLVFFGIFLVLMVSLSQISQASFSGFSSGFYASFIVAIFYITYVNKKELLHLIPITGIILGLLRPDGVIIAVCATFIGFYFAFRQDVLRKYFFYSVVALIIGIAYFLWRYNYFGNLLPLPLYVKGASAESLPGIDPHLNWAYHNRYLIVFSLATILLCKDRWIILLSSFPVGMLFFALIFATQSQNVAFRFQAPGTAILIIWCSILFSKFPEIISKLSSMKIFAFLVLFIISLNSLKIYAGQSIARINDLLDEQYINYLPHHLSDVIKNDTVIALTEAGRFAYWAKGKKYDLVGLNTPEVALENSSPNYIRSLNPDIIFMHVAGTANYNQICDANFCSLTKSEFLEGIVSSQDWRSIDNSVVRAPLTIYEYVISSSENFTIFAALYGGDFYNHIYILKSSGTIDGSEFERGLELSHSDKGIFSYWEIKEKRNWFSIFD